ncbi:MAG: glycerol-3-phosphate ABC transporter ATP-binding protein [Elusimicrobia bacterium RIFOXYA12_FULL_57_11]|nr:MAG: glycerol-3-phosphate ABC transporter ATP-binding protein [Elusimicrobia bacterium RIFOXYA12_FULL_57_11]
MARVILQNVWKRFGDAEIVKDFSLEVPDKEFCVLVGPSGCGKSTTLRMVAGLEEVTAGDIIIGDRRVNDLPPKDRDIAMVFQNYALYPHMTVYENMAFGLKLKKFSDPEISMRVKEAAEILGIAHLLDRKPKQLSGGQRQRVAVGRAIVRKPKVFLFDEPLSNLDAKLRVQMRAELKKMHERLQSTIIYVTHDQTEAMTMGDRICIMKDGSIQQVDNPLSVYEKPDNRFVGGFIGSPPMNFMEAEVIVRGEECFLNEGMFEIAVRRRYKDNVMPYVNKKLILGIRPEDIHDKLSFTLNLKEGNVMSGMVDVVEPLGSEIFLHVNTGKNEIICRVDAHSKVQPNNIIELVVDTRKIHLFEAETGCSILQ